MCGPVAARTPRDDRGENDPGHCHLPDDTCRRHPAVRVGSHSGRRHRSRRHAGGGGDRPAAARQGLRRLQQRHRHDDPGPADHVCGPDPDRCGRDHRPLRVRPRRTQSGDLPARHHGVRCYGVGVHEQYCSHRILRAVGYRIRRQDRRQPLAISPSPCLRIHSHKLGHADQHVHQSGGQRNTHPLSAGPHGHVRDGPGRYSDCRRRPSLRLVHRRAPHSAA